MSTITGEGWLDLAFAVGVMLGTLLVGWIVRQRKRK